MFQAKHFITYFKLVVKGGGPGVDRARKEVIRIFQQEDLKVTTECNSKCTDFLAIIMDLSNNSTRPFIKPNANTKYVSTFSSHPPAGVQTTFPWTIFPREFLSEIREIL
jgi:hypothetical protein